ncbi:MAG: methyltransferase domain-containing protein [Nitrosopumilus sp.]|nr:methyltransferase domain-containing protein [Nitrosopumilus sp.]MDH5665739.1 methyltransferase domain-containing protein [Nitrosopumilus sp.]
MDDKAISEHYGISGILDSILKGLESSGKELASLKPEDLAPIDEFHTRGKDSTMEIANLAQLEPHHNVLDVGCGLGGSARYIAEKYGCNVTGIDLTEQYIDVANRLTEFVKMSDKVSFKQASALEIPFESDNFDVIWTEHTQMNIADKEGFYGELNRVLKPQGRLVFHDVFGTENTAHYPTPWAEHNSLSSLCTQEEARNAIEKSNFTVKKWIDKSSQSLEFFKNMVKKTETSGPPPLGFHLLMGNTAKTKLSNQVRNLEENRISIVQGTASKIGT